MRQLPEVLRMSIQFSSSRFPEKAWNVFFKQEPRGDSMPGQVGRTDATNPNEVASPSRRRNTLAEKMRELPDIFVYIKYISLCIIIL